MASIRQRGSSFWARVRRSGFPTQTGTFDSEAEAKAWAKKVEASMVLGDPRFSEKGTTFGDWIRRYVEEVAPQWTTGDDKASRLNRLLELPIAQRRVETLTPADFEKLRDNLLETGSRRGKGGLAPQTVRHYLQDCSAVWTAARKKWRVTKLPNVLSDVDIPPVSPGRKVRIREGAWEKLRETLANHVNPFYPLYAEFLMETAMRVSEPLGVTYNDVDWEGKVLTVVGKGDRQRMVPLSHRAMELLRQAQELRKQIPKVFSAPNGGCYDLSEYPDDVFWPISYSGFYRSWKKAREVAGVNGAWIHDIRREKASRMMDSGYATAEVALALGHSSLRMVNEHYLVLEAQKLAQKLG